MILIVGLSSAWQRTISFDGFQLGEVNRSARVTEYAAGKGTNCARVATQIGANVRLLTVAGGARGEAFEQSLRQQDIRARIVRVAAETRVCQTLLANGEATELVEEPGALSPVEAGEVLNLYRSQLAKASLVVLIGTVPPGCGVDFYARLVHEATKRDVRVLVDAQGQLLLRAVAEKPFLVRINRTELADATRLTSRRRGSFLTAARKLVRLGAQTLVVSHGSNEIFVWPQGWGWNPPHVNTVNPVGSGDAMMAGFAYALHEGMDLWQATRWGIACGAANAMTSTAGNVRPSDVRALLRRL